MSGMLLWLALPLLPAGTLDQAQRALDAFRVEEGMALLEQARRQGPYSLADHARLYEQLAIANAYLERREPALRAFDMLLALDPGRVLRYTLSPRVTLLFEEARRRSKGQPAIVIELQWPRDRTVADAVPVSIEVLTDRRQLVRSAALFWRGRVSGGEPYRRAPVELAGPRRGQVSIPAAGASLLEFYLVAYDERGNEVYRWHDPERPRELVRRPLVRQPWYKKWWVWAIAGGLVAAGVGVAAGAATWQPGRQVEAGARVIR